MSVPVNRHRRYNASTASWWTTDHQPAPPLCQSLLHIGDAAPAEPAVCPHPRDPSPGQARHPRLSRLINLGVNSSRTETCDACVACLAMLVSASCAIRYIASIVTSSGAIPISDQFGMETNGNSRFALPLIGQIAERRRQVAAKGDALAFAWEIARNSWQKRSSSCRSSANAPLLAGSAIVCSRAASRSAIPTRYCPA